MAGRTCTYRFSGCSSPISCPGALVLADDSTFEDTAGYLDYVRDPANGYVTVTFPVEDGVEISCWTSSGSR
jgi:hypothetical protein